MNRTGHNEKYLVARRKVMPSMKNVFSVALVLLQIAAFSQSAGFSVQQKTPSSGNHYTIFHKGSSKMKFTTARPDHKDTSILLCIAAAFTSLDDGKVDGAYAVNGEVKQEVPNMRLGGAILINGKGCEIFPYHAYPPPSGIIKDPTLSAAMRKKIKQGKYSFFQQIQLIIKGNAERFFDEKLFQRRAIVTYKNSNVSVIESKEPITLATFSRDLVELGAYNALYTDMGDWDEGWYREVSGKIIGIGTSKRQTEKQSNWVVFAK